MNTYRYDEEKRKQWVRDKIARAKTVKQICREASISRATLYNWIDEFKHLEQEIKANDEEDPRTSGKTSRPELLQRTAHEIAERYRMLVSAIAGLDTNKTFSKRLVAMLIKRYTLTVSQACAIVGIDESLYGYKPRKPEVEDYIVYEALIKLIHEDRTRDFETCYELLLKAHSDWTRKQIKRVYRDGMVYLERQRANTRWEKLGKARAQKEKIQSTSSAASPVAKRIQRPGTAWNLSLQEYTSELDGTRQSWWISCIMDEETNEVLNAQAGLGVATIEDILSFLDKAVTENGVPGKLKIPGKSLLTARELTRWVWQHRMALHTFSMNKPENIEAIMQMEQSILRQMNVAHISSRAALQQAAEALIAKP